MSTEFSYENHAAIDYLDTYTPYLDALQLAHLGLSITPPIPFGLKYSQGFEWKEYQTHPATTSQIIEWGLTFDNRNYGIITGRTSGIVVIDADDIEAQQLVQQRCPDTPIMQMSGRGQHFIYRYPTHLAHVPTNKGITVGGNKRKLDIKGDGGLILGPGSLHHSGGIYSMVEPWTAERFAMMPVYDPAWLEQESITTLAEPVVAKKCSSDVALSRRQQLAREYLAERDGSKQGKGKGADSYCLGLAATVVYGFALSPDEALPLMLEWGEKSSNTDQWGGYWPWTEKELYHKLTNAKKPSDKQEGYLLPQPTLADIDFSNYKDEKPNTPLEALNMFPPYKFAPISSAELATARYPCEWLVKNILVKNQPCILGGTKKSLKTSIACDLNLSLGSGQPFLGKFKIDRPCRSVLISGESGQATIQETAFRIAKAKELDLAAVDAHWDYRLPQLSRTDELLSLSHGLRAGKFEVAIIDPLYLCLLSGQSEKNAGNLYDMGPLLMTVANACLMAGCTPILAHHARKHMGSSGEPLDLDDLAFAGIAEFARQWLLLSRRTPYNFDGYHELWFTAGGSVGHGGRWGLDINDGLILDDFTGRGWGVDVISMAELKEVKQSKKEEKKLDDETALDAEFLAALANWSGEAPSKTKFRTAALGWTDQKFSRVAERLEQRGEIEWRQSTVTAGKGAKQVATTLHLCHKKK